MKKATNIALLLAVMVFGFCLNSQAISLTVGTGDYYVNVGDHDYLPYAYQGYGGSQFPALSFQTAMGGYGTWASMQPFGQVWRPYVANGWRPYTNGHWTYTQYGPTWQGYEPFSWATSHYGNWVFSQQMGWVWIPGYEYHGGRVAWSQGYDSIGWTPMPPSGYDYSRGYLSHVGPQNQFTYMDDDFSLGFSIGGGNDYYYGGPYYDQRYRNMYYNQSYLNIAGLLWTFLDPNHFTSDNYADYYYGGDYARYAFDRRLIRISTRPIDRVVLERVVRQQIPVRQVRTNRVRIDGREVQITTIDGEEERIRRNANKTVREVIAPAFAEKGKTFKGEKAQNRTRLEKAWKMENAPRKVQTVTTEEIVRESRQKNSQREQRSAQVKSRKQQEVTRVEKQGKIKERKDRDVKETGTENNRSRSTRTTPAETPRNRPAEVQQQDENQKRRNERAVEAQEKQQQQRNRPAEVQDENRKQNERAVEAQEKKQQEQRNRRPAAEQEEQEKRRNRPNTENKPASDDDEDVRTRNPNPRSTTRPDSAPDVQSDMDRERKSREEAEVRRNQPEQQENAKKSKAEIEKEKKAKTKKAKDKDKQNQDDEPPKE